MVLCFLFSTTLPRQNYYQQCFADRRTGISRRHSMERMELMKLTPDKKGETQISDGGARPKIPKVQKSHSLAADVLTPAQSRLEEVETLK